MKELILVFLGFFLSLVPHWFLRKRRLKTHWCALRAEMDHCKEKANNLLTHGIRSPLYRLPIMSYQVSFPVLLADGAVQESDVAAITGFFSLAQEINRGLDNAAEMAKANETEKLKNEFNRNCLKAKELILKC